jgi:hypothetical protein
MTQQSSRGSAVTAERIDQRVLPDVEARIRASTVKLARLACDLDEVVQQITSDQPNDSHQLLLAAPAAHLAGVVDQLEQTLYEIDLYSRSYGLGGRPALTLTARARPDTGRMAA